MLIIQLLIYQLAGERDVALNEVVWFDNQIATHALIRQNAIRQIRVERNAGFLSSARIIVGY